MDHVYRRNQILDILRNEETLTQRDVRRALAQRGIRVTQATVSRDMEELGLVKTREGYRAPGSVEATGPAQPSLEVILKEFLLEARQAANLVIVKTHPGSAHTVAVALDTSGWTELLGTVAGDDTIFLATAGARQAASLRKRIHQAVAE